MVNGICISGPTIIPRIENKKVITQITTVFGIFDTFTLRRITPIPLFSAPVLLMIPKEALEIIIKKIILDAATIPRGMDLKISKKPTPFWGTL